MTVALEGHDWPSLTYSLSFFMPLTVCSCIGSAQQRVYRTYRKPYLSIFICLYFKMWLRPERTKWLVFYMHRLKKVNLNRNSVQLICFLCRHGVRLAPWHVTLVP